MVEQNQGRKAPSLTQERSFEFHRSGGSVEPASPTELARQDEDALDMTPVGARRDLRRATLTGVLCGVALGLALGAIALLPWSFATTWPRVGVMAAIGFLAGTVYGALLGAARRAR